MFWTQCESPSRSEAKETSVSAGHGARGHRGGSLPMVSDHVTPADSEVTESEARGFIAFSVDMEIKNKRVP